MPVCPCTPVSDYCMTVIRNPALLYNGLADGAV